MVFFLSFTRYHRLPRLFAFTYIVWLKRLFAYYDSIGPWFTFSPRVFLQIKLIIEKEIFNIYPKSIEFFEIIQYLQLI